MNGQRATADADVPRAYLAIVVGESPVDAIAFRTANEAVKHDWTDASEYLTTREIEKERGFDSLVGLPDDDKRIENESPEVLFER